MLYGINDTVRRALQADGFVPCRFADVWIGDIVIQNKSVLDGNGIRYLTIVDATAETSRYVDGDFGDFGITKTSVVVTNTLLKAIVRDQDGILDHLTINIEHETWVKQCEANVRRFGSIADYLNREIPT